jgi:hypothetical protein
VIYIYRPRYSEGAEDLAYALSEAGIRARYVRSWERLSRAVPGDTVICWGAVPDGNLGEGIRMINAVPLQSKYQDAQTLAAAGVPTVEVSRVRPVVLPPSPPTFAFSRTGLHDTITQAQADIVIGMLEAFKLERPAPVEEWLPRANSHAGGNDLLRANLINPDFWVKKEDLIDEFRIHSFNGKSIRAGQKVQRANRPDGSPAHPWIRSFDAGWVLQYDGFSSTEGARALAAKAVESLGLQFGAVDLAQRRDGTLMVLEVNRAPGVEGGTIQAYVKAIQRLLED